MTRAVETILDAALPLSPKERAEIITRLIRSLDGPEPTPQEQAEIDEAWLVEIRRRSKEIDEGKTTLVPGDEFLARLRRRAAGGEEP